VATVITEINPENNTVKVVDAVDLDGVTPKLIQAGPRIIAPPSPKFIDL